MKILPLYLPQQGCPHHCIYCNQSLVVNSPRETELWAERLAALAGHSASETWEIAFYGGTFSALSQPIMNECFRQVHPYLSLPHVKGIRISTRPDFIDASMLAYLKQNGVTTIELGGESFDEQVLRCIGRGHDAETFRQACHAILAHGFILGLHLMCGLPGQSHTSWEETIQESIRIHPHFVRIAPTLVLKNTPLEALYHRGEYVPLPLEEAILLLGYAYKEFLKCGIVIIRVGLAVSDNESDGREKITAGPWHPALRHEIEAGLAKLSVQKALADTQADTIIIHPKDISIVQGSHRRNLGYWQETIYRNIAIQTEESQARFTFRVRNQGEYSLFNL